MALKWFLQPFNGWLVRIGPEAEKYGDAYLWCVPISDRGELTGFSSRRPTASGLKAALHAANTLGFYNPIIERRGVHPRTLVVSEGLIKGVFSMSKHKYAHVEEKHAADGSIDPAVAKANVASYNEAVQSGKVHVLAVGDPVAVPGMPGVVAKLVIMKE